jgi:hypothetical protein
VHKVTGEFLSPQSAPAPCFQFSVICLIKGELGDWTPLDSGMSAEILNDFF